MRLEAPVEGCATTLVHPVASRRLGGAGAGVDLNPDRSCNWRCAYCDVTGLVDRKADRIDLPTLERELSGLLAALRETDWLERHAPEGRRELRGVLISGHGEPTLSFQLLGAVDVLERVLASPAGAGLEPVLVTNGSNVSNRKVREGLERLASLGGEIWFKLDSATREGQRGFNRVDTPLRQARENMRVSASLCPTIVQTCVFTRDGEPSLDEREQSEYTSFLSIQLRAGVPLRGVALHVPDRPSEQADGARIGAPPRDWLDAFADRVRDLNIDVSVHA